jgi:hypothetical protein
MHAKIEVIFGKGNFYAVRVEVRVDSWGQKVVVGCNAKREEEDIFGIRDQVTASKDYNRLRQRML